MILLVASNLGDSMIDKPKMSPISHTPPFSPLGSSWAQADSEAETGDDPTRIPLPLPQPVLLPLGVPHNPLSSFGHGEHQAQPQLHVYFSNTAVLIHLGCLWPTQHTEAFL